MFERTRSFLHRLTLGASGDPSSEDRRSFERYPIDRETIIQVGYEDGDEIRGRIQDVSRGGLRVLVDEPLDSGSMIRLALPRFNGESTTTVLACVVHIQPIGSGFSIGCNFSTELNDSDLIALGAQKARPVVRDQRAWTRVPVMGEAVYTRLKTSREPARAAIHNISPTGVALHMNEQIDPGTLLNLELHNSSGQSVLTIVACVVYLTALTENEWLAGCNFVRELYDEDLSALIAPSPRH